VFRAFASTVAEGENGFVVLDTAPTGHTLLLLDAAEAYHREVSRTLGSGPDAVRQLLPRLRNPEFTRVLLVTCRKPPRFTRLPVCRMTCRERGSSPLHGS
jgi:arsenite-transporting ATPase